MLTTMVLTVLKLCAGCVVIFGAWTTPRTWVPGELVTASMMNVHVRDNLNSLKADLAAAGASAAYPVGSIYLSVVSTNPSTTLGFGTWAAFGPGRTLVCVDAGQTEFDTVEETGGAKAHTLTTGEMPAHAHVHNAHGHSARFNAGGTGSGANAIGAAFDNTHLETGNDNIIATTSTEQNAGGGAAHNNLQPYITCYIWKRTA